MQFGRSSFWYHKLPADVPIDGNSANYVNSLLAAGTANGYTFNYRDWSYTLFYAAPDDPTTTVIIDKDPTTLATGSYVDMAKIFTAVPIPKSLRPPGPWPGDNHTEIYQPSTDTMWGFWRLSKFEVDGAHSDGNVTGATHLSDPGWHAEFGMGIQNVSKNQGFFDTTSWPGITTAGRHLSTTSAGLPIGGGVITVDEAQQNYIPHALLMQAGPQSSTSSTFRYPATKSDGTSSDPNAIPMGACFKLPGNYNVTSISDPFVRAVCTAMRDYGIYVHLCGGNVAIRCESRATVPGSQSYTTDPWKGAADTTGSIGALFTASPATLAAQIPWSSLQVVDASYRAPTSILTGL